MSYDWKIITPFIGRPEADWARGVGEEARPWPNHRLVARDIDCVEGMIQQSFSNAEPESFAGKPGNCLL
jgi:hypothetical protein